MFYSRNLDVDGTTELDGLNVDGNTSLDNTNIVGILTVSERIEVDNIRIDGNEIDTVSGNITIDSAGGLTTVDDNISVTGTGQFDGAVNMDTSLEVDSVFIDGNVVTTKAGDLVLDSANGNIDINDNIDVSGTSTLQGQVTVNTGIVPDTDEGAYLGTASLPFSEAHIGEVRIANGANMPPTPPIPKVIVVATTFKNIIKARSSMTISLLSANFE